MSMQQPDETLVSFGGLKIDISQLDVLDRSSNVNSVRISCAVFIVLVVFTVALRIFARARYVRRIFADDSMFWVRSKRIC